MILLQFVDIQLHGRWLLGPFLVELAPSAWGFGLIECEEELANRFLLELVIFFDFAPERELELIQDLGLL